MSTAKHIIDAVAFKVGDPGIAQPRGLYLEAINNAIDTIINQDNFGTFSEEYSTSIADELRYKLPSYTLNVLAMFYDGKELEEKSVNEIFDMISDTESMTSSTLPAYFATERSSAGLVLYLYPVPSTACTMRFLLKRTYPRITADDISNELPFPESIVTAVKMLSTAEMLESMGQTKEAVYWRNEGEKAMVRSRSAYKPYNKKVIAGHNAQRHNFWRRTTGS